VKISAPDRAERDAIVERLCQGCAAERVQRVGHVAVLFRANPEKKRPLPLPRA
jgi:RNA-binding protein